MNQDAHRSAGSHSSRSATALYAVCLAVGWVWLVAGTHLDEMIVGAAMVTLATAFVRLVQTSRRQTIDLAWRDIARGWRIPGYLVQDLWLVTGALFRDLVHVRRAGSYYRVCGFGGSGRDPKRVAQGVLETLYSTSTPNVIVVGIDSETGKMLFHQIERTGLSEMARALGAQS